MGGRRRYVHVMKWMWVVEVEMWLGKEGVEGEENRGMKGVLTINRLEAKNKQVTIPSDSIRLDDGDLKKKACRRMLRVVRRKMDRVSSEHEWEAGYSREGRM